MRVLPRYSLSDIDFETESREAKSASTEDSGLKILAGVAKESDGQILVVERPSPGSVGEFDAICCTESGLIVVELKRYGGMVRRFELLDPEIRIRNARTEKRIANPSAVLAEKSRRLVHEILTDDGWTRVKRLYSGRIPVFNIVCYGPSTEFEMLPANRTGNYICSTRTLSRTVWDILESKTGVVGAGAQMASLASTWVQWGILTSHRKGFLRCSLARITSSKWDASAWGLESMRSDGETLALAYENGRTVELPFDGEVWLKAYVNGGERTVQIEQGSRFRWRVDGR